MKKLIMMTMVLAAVLIAAVLLISGCRDTKTTTTEPTEVFLATMFDSSGHSNIVPNCGMLAASSTDGVNFHNVSDSIEPLYTPPANGMRDPSVLYWQGQWYMVHSYAHNISSLVFLLKSSDLLQWEPIGSLRLREDTGGPADNYINIPHWVVDTEGNVHIIACTNYDTYRNEIHPLSADPATWGDQDNWSAPATMTDANDNPLVQGNSFVALKDGTYYMAFNEVDVSLKKFYMRTSTDLVSGWSAPRLLDIDSSGMGPTGESENIIFLADGTLRYYISASNAIGNMIWYVDSADLGITWISPKLVKFSGFGPKKVNWAQFIRVVNPPTLEEMGH